MDSEIGEEIMTDFEYVKTMLGCELPSCQRQLSDGTIIKLERRTRETIGLDIITKGHKSINCSRNKAGIDGRIPITQHYSEDGYLHERRIDENARDR